MNPFLLSNKNRLREWNNLKNEIKNYDDLTQLRMVIEFWSQAPLVNFLLDPDDANMWPDPWEIINGGKFCNVSLAYLMEQTLVLSDEEKWMGRIKLLYIDDKSISNMLMVTLVDNKYLMNYSQNQLIDFDKVKENCIIQNTYCLFSKYKHKSV